MFKDRWITLDVAAFWICSLVEKWKLFSDGGALKRLSLVNLAAACCLVVVRILLVMPTGVMQLM